jgi:hypothetical protein
MFVMNNSFKEMGVRSRVPHLVSSPPLCHDVCFNQRLLAARTS